MQFSARFTGGTLKGKEMLWRSHAVCFGAELYITRYVGKCKLPVAYRFAGIRPLLELKGITPVNLADLHDATPRPRRKKP